MPPRPKGANHLSLPGAADRLGVFVFLLPPTHPAPLAQAMPARLRVGRGGNINDPQAQAMPAHLRKDAGEKGYDSTVNGEHHGDEMVDNEENDNGWTIVRGRAQHRQEQMSAIPSQYHNHNIGRWIQHNVWGKGIQSAKH